MARQERSARIRSLGPIIGALVGWALIIVVGAGPSVDDSLLGVDGLDDVWTVILFAVAFFGLLVFIVLNPFTSTFTAPERQRRGRGAVVMFIVLLLVIWRPDLIDWLFELTNNGDDSIEPQQPVAADDPVAEGETTPAGAVARASEVAMLVGALVAVAGLWWVIRSRSGSEPEPADLAGVSHAPEAELAGAVGQAAVALDAEDDPRLGVLRAYAILEQTLADQGTPRTRAETPREHLQRALSGLAVDTKSLLSLADLYELARFSERPITPTDRSHAAALLDDAQRQLSTPEVL